MYIGRDWKESCFIHGSRKRGPEKVLAMQEVGVGGGGDVHKKFGTEVGTQEVSSR